MKSVVIVGGGPSGLVAAKTLLNMRLPETPEVTLLEKGNTLGGLWAVDEHKLDGKLDPRMPTNLSKFSVAFSDLAWDSVAFGSSPESEASRKTPMFPKAWQVQRYLKTYADRYIRKDVIRLNCNVVGAEQVHDDDGLKWKIRWEDTGANANGSDETNGDGSDFKDKSHEQVFDYMIVCSGFFSSPRELSCAVESETDNVPKDQIHQMLHSSRLRSLNDVVHPSWDGRGDILVIGGGMSGAEAAALLAFQLSSRQHSPGTTDATTDARVVHVISQAFYAVPPIIPITLDFQQQRGFTPLDLVFYDLSRRPPGPITPALGKVTKERAELGHKFFRSIIGDDQSSLEVDPLVSTVTDKPPYVCISESYSEFARSRLITPVTGRVSKLEHWSNKDYESKLSRFAATVSTASGEKRLDNITGVVYATGYSPLPALSFISPSVRNRLNFDERNCRIPILLQNIQTGSTNIENLAFVGLYEAPSWGVMEMQARLIAESWFSVPKPTDGHQNSNEIEKLKDLRSGIVDNDKSVPQLLFDYVGMVESTATDLGFERDDTSLGERAGPLLPARYTDSGSDRDEAGKTMEHLCSIMDHSHSKGGFVARAAFRALQGDWKLERRLNSAISTFPSGLFTADASFNPRDPTDDDYLAEYLYMENGELVTDQGFTMNAARRYVYRYQEHTDSLSVWFVKDDGKTVDYLFHNLQLEIEQSTPHLGTWSAKANHPCGADMYDTSYEFRFRGIMLESFRVKHAVTGPKKDYISDSLFRRRGSKVTNAQ